MQVLTTNKFSRFVLQLSLMNVVVSPLMALKRDKLVLWKLKNWELVYGRGFLHPRHQGMYMLIVKKAIILCTLSQPYTFFKRCATSFNHQHGNRWVERRICSCFNAWWRDNVFSSRLGRWQRDYSTFMLYYSIQRYKAIDLSTKLTKNTYNKTENSFQCETVNCS